MLGGTHTYKSGSSSTYKPWNMNFQITYGDNTGVSGTFANDTVTVCKIYLLC